MKSCAIVINREEYLSSLPSIITRQCARGVVLRNFATLGSLQGPYGPLFYLSIGYNMIEFFLILTGCFIIIIYHLVKKIVHLRQDIEILAQLFQMRIVTKVAEDHPDHIDVIIGDEDGENNRSRQTQTTSED